MYEKFRYQMKLILFEVKASIHTNIYEYTRNVNIDTNWKNSMIPIDTTIIASVHLILQNEEYELVKMKSFVN